LETAERLAEELHVPSRTIRRDAAFAKAIDKIEDAIGPEAKSAILSGKCKLGKAAIVEAAELPPKKMAAAKDHRQKKIAIASLTSPATSTPTPTAS
jgi:hypothetical protein